MSFPSFFENLKEALHDVIAVLSSSWFWIICGLAWIENFYVFLTFALGLILNVSPLITIFVPLGLIILIVFVKVGLEEDRQLKQLLKSSRNVNGEKALQYFVKEREKRNKG